jgi:hypothetical protein
VGGGLHRVVAGRQVVPLGREDLELLATAAHLLGRVEDCLRALQRHAEGGDLRRAARNAFWLAFHLINHGELTQASGWLARANRLLEHEQECAERGYLLLPVALQQGVAADFAAAQRTAARAAAIGRHAADANLVALALSVHGRILVREGRVGEGLVLLDEAMVAVVAGELSPPVAGAVYCSVIDACQEVLEWRRAHEWTDALAAWCGKQPDMVTYTGQCLVHRAEILQLHGAWPQAVEEARRASERLARGADSYAVGAAFYRQGEVHQVLGTSRRRRRPTDRPAAMAWSRSRGWPCCGWPRAGPTPPRRRSAGSSSRPPRGSGGPSCCPLRSRSCWPSATCLRPTTPPTS